LAPETNLWFSRPWRAVPARAIAELLHELRDSYKLPFRFTGKIDKLTYKLGPEQLSA
jgi:hypothetical protein